MKQRINQPQLSKLSQEVRDTLRSWWKPQVGDWIIDGDDFSFLVGFVGSDEEYMNDGNTEDPLEASKVNSLPLLSIDQMFQFLLEHQNPKYDFEIKKLVNGIGELWQVFYQYTDETGIIETEVELCDALWKIVETILLRKAKE